MPRRFFKPLTRQRHVWTERWFMRPFKLLLGNPAYWSLNRRNVTRAFALGLFLSFVPLPINTLLGVTMALLMRVNIPATLSGTLLTNPLTMLPLYYAAYWIGCTLLGIDTRPFAIELSWEWLTTGLLPIWKPFLLGCLVMGLASAATGYLLLGGIWHLTLVLEYRKRKDDGPAKASAAGKE